MNGIITDSIKNQVGRPRPDFFYRCFVGGVVPAGQPTVFDLQCTNPFSEIVLEGRRSFPSGHSSFIFSFAVWISLYLAGKLKYFHFRRTEQLLLIIAFPLAATLVG